MLTFPFPLTAAVTSYSTQLPEAIAPWSDSAPPIRAERFVQLMPASVQPEVVTYAAGPSAVAFEAKTRSLALLTWPPTPVTEKRM
jgi:hypothetical protein